MSDIETNAGQADEVRRLREENARLRGENTTMRFDWRTFLAVSALVLGLISLVPAGGLLWLNRTVTNTDRYVAAVGPAIHEPAVQKAIQQSATYELLSRIDVDQEVASALPDRAQFLAAPIATQVKNYTSNVIGQIVASDQFANIWVNSNRRAHERFMTIATSSDGNPTVTVDDLYGFIQTQLAQTRLGPLVSRALPASVGSVTVVTIPALAWVPHFVAQLGLWQWVLLGLALVLLAGAILLARDRRRMLTRMGIGFMITAILTLVIVRLSRQVMLAQFADPVYREAAAAMWQSLLNAFYIQTAVLFFLGVAASAVAWLAGPGRLAARIRSDFSHWLVSLRRNIWPAADDTGWVNTFRRHHIAMLWALLFLTVASLLIFAPLTIGSLAGVIVVALVVLLGIEFVSVQETDSEKPATAAEHTHTVNAG